MAYGSLAAASCQLLCLSPTTTSIATIILASHSVGLTMSISRRQSECYID